MSHSGDFVGGVEPFGYPPFKPLSVNGGIIPSGPSDTGIKVSPGYCSPGMLSNVLNNAAPTIVPSYFLGEMLGFVQGLETRGTPAQKAVLMKNPVTDLLKEYFTANNTAGIVCSLALFAASRPPKTESGKRLGHSILGLAPVYDKGGNWHIAPGLILKQEGDESFGEDLDDNGLVVDDVNVMTTGTPLGLRLSQFHDQMTQVFTHPKPETYVYSEKAVTNSITKKSVDIENVWLLFMWLCSWNKAKGSSSVFGDIKKWSSNYNLGTKERPVPSLNLMTANQGAAQKIVHAWQVFNLQTLDIDQETRLKINTELCEFFNQFAGKVLPANDGGKAFGRKRAAGVDLQATINRLQGELEMSRKQQKVGLDEALLVPSVIKIDLEKFWGALFHVVLTDVKGAVQKKQTSVDTMGITFTVKTSQISATETKTEVGEVMLNPTHALIARINTKMDGAEIPAAAEDKVQIPSITIVSKHPLAMYLKQFENWSTVVHSWLAKVVSHIILGYCKSNTTPETTDLVVSNFTYPGVASLEETEKFEVMKLGVYAVEVATRLTLAQKNSCLAALTVYKSNPDPYKTVKTVFSMANNAKKIKQAINTMLGLASGDTDEFEAKDGYANVACNVLCLVLNRLEQDLAPAMRPTIKGLVKGFNPITEETTLEFCRDLMYTCDNETARQFFGFDDDELPTGALNFVHYLKNGLNGYAMTVGESSDGPVIKTAFMPLLGLKRLLTFKTTNEEQNASGFIQRQEAAVEVVCNKIRQSCKKDGVFREVGFVKFDNPKFVTDTMSCYLYATAGEIANFLVQWAKALGPAAKRALTFDPATVPFTKRHAELILEKFPAIGIDVQGTHYRLDTMAPDVVVIDPATTYIRTAIIASMFHTHSVVKKHLLTREDEGGKLVDYHFLTGIHPKIDTLIRRAAQENEEEEGAEDGDA